ncbi:MAG: hypothetical protein AAF384_04265 [Pseudomonadota bacterium]
MCAWLLSLAAFALHLFVASHANFAGFAADDALYLMMADALSPYSQPDVAAIYVGEVSHLPPFYPFLLALVGAGSEQIDIAHVLQVVLFIVGLGAVMAVAARVIGNPWVGIGLFSVFALSPYALILNTQIWSEFCFIALCYGGLLAVIERPKEFAPFAIAAFAFGLLAVTRGLGVAAIFALITVVIVERRRYLIPVVLLALLPSIVTKALGFGGVSHYFEIFNSYILQFSLWDLLRENSVQLWRGWIRVFDRHERLMTHVISAAVLLFVILGLTRRLRELRIDALFTVAYLMLLFLWPFPNAMSRLLFPITPLLLIYACHGLVGALWIPRIARLPAALSVTLIFSAISLSSSAPLVRNVFRELPGELAYLRASGYWLEVDDPAQALASLRRRHALIKTAKVAETIVPYDQCIYSLRPQLVMFYARRPSFGAAPSRERGSAPVCRYHMVFNDSSLLQEQALLWPDREVVHTESVDGDTVGVLVHYSP